MDNGMTIDGVKYEAADVLGGAYADQSLKSLLIHVIVTMPDGSRKCLCRGVQFDNLITDADRTDRLPTCSTCAKRLWKLATTEKRATFAPVEVAYRVPGKAPRRRVLKTQRAMDAFLAKLSDDGGEVLAYAKPEGSS